MLDIAKHEKNKEIHTDISVYFFVPTV